MQDSKQLTTKYIDLISNGIHNYLSDAAHEFSNFLNESFFIKDKHNYFFCGNGGSAATAEHAAIDLGIVAPRKSKYRFSCISLVSNKSALTCIGNDQSFDDIFSQQLIDSAIKGDSLITFSGSGNSPNIIKAIKVANELGLRIFSFIGFDGGVVKKISTRYFHFPINDMQVVEDLHLSSVHLATRLLIEK